MNNFSVDPDAPKTYEYYMLDRRPVRATIWNQAIIQTETPNIETKELVIDNLFIIEILEDHSAIEVDKNDFTNACLALGVKIPKD